MKKIKVRIDKEACIQCGTCYSALPEVFESTEDGTADIVAVYKGEEIDDPEMIEKIIQARDMCPSGAIIVEEIE